MKYPLNDISECEEPQILSPSCNLYSSKANRLASIALYAFLAAASLIPQEHSAASTGSALSLGIGLPSSYMDLMTTGSVKLRLKSVVGFYPEFRTALSFATKGDGAGGRISQITLSEFLLARYSCFRHEDKIEAAISGGPGIHLLNSWSSRSSYLGGYSRTLGVIKAHCLLGFDFSLTPSILLSLEGRLTVPSDVIVDLVSVGICKRL